MVGHGGGSYSVSERVERADERVASRRVRRPAVADGAARARAAGGPGPPPPAPARRVLPTRATAGTVPALLQGLHA